MATISLQGAGFTNSGAATWTNTANIYDNTTTTFGTWTNATNGGTNTAYVTTYGFSSYFDSAATINSVTLNTKQYVSNVTNMSAPKVQAYVGVTAKGSQTTLTNSTTTTNSQNVTLTGLTAADLVDPTFQIQLIALHGANTTSATLNVDYLQVTVDYTPILNWPSSPTTGQFYTFSGVTYQYDGYGWEDASLTETEKLGIMGLYS